MDGGVLLLQPNASSKKSGIVPVEAGMQAGLTSTNPGIRSGSVTTDHQHKETANQTSSSSSVAATSASSIPAVARIPSGQPDVPVATTNVTWQLQHAPRTHDEVCGESASQDTASAVANTCMHGAGKHEASSSKQGGGTPGRCSGSCSSPEDDVMAEYELAGLFVATRSPTISEVHVSNRLCSAMPTASWSPTASSPTNLPPASLLSQTVSKSGSTSEAGRVADASAAANASGSRMSDLGPLYHQVDDGGPISGPERQQHNISQQKGKRNTACSRDMVTGVQDIQTTPPCIAASGRNTTRTAQQHPTRESAASHGTASEVVSRQSISSAGSLHSSIGSQTSTLGAQPAVEAERLPSIRAWQPTKQVMSSKPDISLSVCTSRVLSSSSPIPPSQRRTGHTQADRADKLKQLLKHVRQWQADRHPAAQPHHNHARDVVMENVACLSNPEVEPVQTGIDSATQCEPVMPDSQGSRTAWHPEGSISYGSGSVLHHSAGSCATISPQRRRLEAALDCLPAQDLAHSQYKDIAAQLSKLPMPSNAGWVRRHQPYRPSSNDQPLSAQDESVTNIPLCRRSCSPGPQQVFGTSSNADSQNAYAKLMRNAHSSSSEPAVKSQVASITQHQEADGVQVPCSSFHTETKTIAAHCASKKQGQTNCQRPSAVLSKCQVRNGVAKQDDDMSANMRPGPELAGVKRLPAAPAVKRKAWVSLKGDVQLAGMVDDLSPQHTVCSIRSTGPVTVSCSNNYATCKGPDTSLWRSDSGDCGSMSSSTQTVTSSISLRAHCGLNTKASVVSTDSTTADTAPAAVAGRYSSPHGEDHRCPAGIAAALSVLAAVAAGQGRHGLQQQDIKQWLRQLQLHVHVAGEAVSLLVNPLRNGTLLCQLAAALSGVHVQGAVKRPADIGAARDNMIRAFTHLGLIGRTFAELTYARNSAKHSSDASRSCSPDAGSYDRQCKGGSNHSKSTAPGRNSGMSKFYWSNGLDKSPELVKRVHAGTTLDNSKMTQFIGNCSVQGGMRLQDVRANSTLAAQQNHTGVPGSRVEHQLLKIIEHILQGNPSSVWGVLYGLKQQFPTNTLAQHAQQAAYRVASCARSAQVAGSRHSPAV
eukprot:jgi/Chrzof1/9345/UNPLg00316.t1